MRITYELTAAEFVAAQRLHSRRNPVGYFNLAICYVLAPPLGIFLMLSVVSFPKEGFTLSSLAKEILPILITLAPLWIHLYWRDRFKSSRVSNGPRIVDFQKKRIVSEMPGVSRSTVEWAAIKKHRESKRILLVYISGVSFWAIPRRAFTKEQYDELLPLLREKLSSRN